MDGVVHGGVYGEEEGIEIVVLKYVHGILSGVLSAVFVESVFHSESGWVPDAADTERKCCVLRKILFVSLTPAVCSWAQYVGQMRRLAWRSWE